MNTVIYYIFVSIAKLIWSFSYVHFLSICHQYLLVKELVSVVGFDFCLFHLFNDLTRR